MLFRDVARKWYGRHIRPFEVAREKRNLRSEIMSTPISDDCPFEVEAKLLRSIKIAESAMLDIGANTGFYSAVLEDVFGSDNVFLFEPLPDLNQVLQDRFPRCHVINIALSESSGRAIMRIPVIHGKLYPTRATLNFHREVGQTSSQDVEVVLRPLDAVIEELQPGSVGFVKIDVEGHELQVLRGAAETISKHKPLLLIEIEARHHDFPIEDLFTEVEGMGYSGFYVNPGSLSVHSVSEFDSERDQNLAYLESGCFSRYLNSFLFVPKESETEFVDQVSAFLRSEAALVD